MQISIIKNNPIKMWAQIMNRQFKDTGGTLAYREIIIVTSHYGNAFIKFRCDTITFLLECYQISKYKYK